MLVFWLYADPLTWATGMHARLIFFYNYTDAMRVNVVVSLLMPEVQFVFAHAFPVGMDCTLEDLYA